MSSQTPAPPMTSHKAIWAGVASIAVTLLLNLLGVMPTTEEAFAADLQSLMEQVAALAIIGAVPAAAAYYKRNFLK